MSGSEYFSLLFCPIFNMKHNVGQKMKYKVLV